MFAFAVMNVLQMCACIAVLLSISFDVCEVCVQDP